MSPSPQAVIRLQGVSKVFPDVPPGTPPALSSLTADVPSGLVVGLVGPDAAGKTTLMRLLAGLLLPTSGSVEVLGRVPGSEASDEAVHDVGYMPQRFGLYEDLSVIDNLNLHAELRGNQVEDVLLAHLSGADQVVDDRLPVRFQRHDRGIDLVRRDHCLLLHHLQDIIIV